MANTRASTAKQQQKSKSRSAGRSRKRRQVAALGTPKKSRKTSSGHGSPVGILPGGEIPAWQTLPYHVLLSIFKYASYPLLDDNFGRKSSVSWLIDAATVCKDFIEPALSALYESPPLTFAHQFRALERLLRRGGPTAIAYALKVRSLKVHIEHIKLGKAVDVLEDLIPNLKSLRGLGLYSSSDDPRRDTVSSKAICDPTYRWLDAISTQVLQELHLSGFSLGPEGPARLLEDARFHHLQDLSLSAMSAHWLVEVAQRDILKSMSSLVGLTFMRCGLGLDNEDRDSSPVLAQIPSSLTRLSFIQCPSITSDDLTGTLTLSGTNLKTLELRHNDDLNLDFVCHLQAACPNLQNLYYDLSLFSPLIASIHHEPGFDKLLSTDESLTWPRTLQELELLQLRQWTGESAKRFFQSLVISAEHLNNLRRIHITASIDAGWRERASFREETIKTIYQTFSKPWVEPSAAGRISRVEPVPPDGSLKASSRRQGESHSRKASNHGGAPLESSSSSPRRTLPRRAVNFSYKEAEERDHAKETEHSRGCHGNCDFVHVRVDNLRPAEEQMNEDDFLDSAPSDDDAWDPAKGDIDDD